MKCISLLLFVTTFGGIFRPCHSTCVLESEFGFVLNCAFKKSGLFRVRNLGGVKAHIGLGFSVGDDLGFKESLSNTEVDKRRSVQISNMQAQLIDAQQKQKQQTAKQKQAKYVNADKVISHRSASPSVESAPASSMQVVPPLAAGAYNSGKDSEIPPFKPIPPAAERPNLNSDSLGMMFPSSLHSIRSPTFSHSFVGANKLPVDPSVTKVVLAVPKRNFAQSSNIKISDRVLHTANNGVLEEVPQQTSNSLHSLLSANNITEEALEQALIRQRPEPSTTTTRRPVKRPVTSKYANSVGKVMNAPKEYYPVGYDKNFDDNFASRVELPDTSFYCGDQKHFPGLYADEDLGCMVFHVCALTDDGLIMKSFLCPESTLFDQTILKCNWWFYVDCKNSKKLYDSNIPISKSYQLMKALTFFSSYKKDSSSTVKPSKD